MGTLEFEKDITALLIIDPYNDFISEGGKFWDRMRHLVQANDCVPHMLQVLNAAREAGLRVFYALHHRYGPGDYENLEAYYADSENELTRKVFRRRHVGWRDSQRIRNATCRSGALVFQWICQHRP